MFLNSSNPVTSSSLMQPDTSVLLRKTSRLAQQVAVACQRPIWPHNFLSYLFHQESLKFSLAIVDPCAVGGIHHPDESIRLFKIVSPV